MKYILCCICVCLPLFTYAATSYENAYTVKKNDTVDSVAKKFGITKTGLLKNNIFITADSIKPGDKIAIIPEIGTSILIAQNTSVQALETQFHLTSSDIYYTNPLVTGSLVESGREVFIPGNPDDIKKYLLSQPQVLQTKGGTQVDFSTLSKQIATSYLSQVFTTAFGASTIEQNKGSILSSWYQVGRGAFGFAPGNCTDYAASRRPDIFEKGKGFRGNAKDWAKNAEKAGYTVSKTRPKVGSIAVFAPGKGGDATYGHVAYVEAFDVKKGTILIDEMNYLGRNIVTRRVTNMSLPIGYIY